ncbi:hypothetical protein GCM10010381_67100 [Streptomyces xantholiticus]|nr:hypothetical protein GCM10010381_67100 [Streptomyces xantholiticus]
MRAAASEGKAAIPFTVPPYLAEAIRFITAADDGDDAADEVSVA